ncbi:MULTISPECIES: hypothetical protein [Dyadobacter]|jgi:hypothetical protein|uniref:YokE-like PH domain-containing protein n=1 Tax=Dyadobacter chenhuakuii TaxID=2909339 RepID=A0A9X1QFQ2_9BACT|nr:MULTISPECIES: hypothetical protein [Dyadobacter]MCE7073254.1 hypothetical protein [Dyadobacter sp. CY327]MCF2496214.1 hypothetical protein [Dyadobacter chenhuakuii]MCF2499647.1 hypothetical protein [Dyadobacter chenhuakuii]MCF2520625.1 hypothetical protein [Dyadobacter sp. CY351]USJ30277.1 hypothetical protein NFI80_20730 [Dyadobacter chenhuakuii]
MNERYSASGLMNPFFPDSVSFGDKGVTFTVKKLFKSNDNFVFYSDISGVEIESGMFFSTIRVIPRMRPEIIINNFTKSDAKRVKELILQQVQG